MISHGTGDIELHLTSISKLKAIEKIYTDNLSLTPTLDVDIPVFTDISEAVNSTGKIGMIFYNFFQFIDCFHNITNIFLYF